VTTPDRAAATPDATPDVAAAGDSHATAEAPAAGDSAATVAERQLPDLRYAALGAAGVVQDRLAGLARGATGVTYAVVRPVVATAVPLVPAPVRRAGAGAVRRLDEQGRAMATGAASGATRAAEALADRLVAEPAVMRVVDRFIDQVQWRVIDAVLPAVLERLAAEPEQVRDIVLGQSRGMVEELTDTARARAVAGDQAVDRFLGRLLRRQPAGGATPDGRAADGHGSDGHGSDGHATVEVPPADGLPPDP
jgi:hypothetical protein